MAVPDPEAAAEIDIIEINSMSRQLAHMGGEPREAPSIGRHAENLRSEVGADSAPRNPPGVLVRPVEPSRLSPIDAEFVMVVARRDMPVPARENVGIDPDRHRGPHSTRRDVARRFD